MISRTFVLALLTIFLSGCMTNLLRPPREEWPEIGHEFSRALRWGGPILAAPFFAESARPAFLAAYGEDQGLQVTNVRHDTGGPAVCDKAQGILTVEYYRSPSVSVKNNHIPLEWSCIDAGRLLPCRWQITTLLSRLP